MLFKTNNVEWCLKKFVLIVQLIVLLHNNARPHFKNATVQLLKKVGWKVVDHPKLMSQSCTNDYHLFLEADSMLYKIHKS